MAKPKPTTPSNLDYAADPLASAAEESPAEKLEQSLPIAPQAEALEAPPIVLPVNIPPPRPVEVSVPLAVPSAGYKARHVDVQLDARQAAALRRLCSGLDQSGARLANGRRVVNAADSLRWLLETLHSAAQEG